MIGLLLGALSLFNSTIKDCTPGGSISNILGFGVSPLNPVPNENASLWVNFDLFEQVDSGSIVYTYTYNFVPFPPTETNLCEENTCPFTAGIHNVSGTSTFPDMSGLLEVKIEWNTGDGTPIWCVDASYTV